MFAVGKERLPVGRSVCRWDGAFAVGEVRLPLGTMRLPLRVCWDGAFAVGEVRLPLGRCVCR